MVPDIRLYVNNYFNHHGSEFGKLISSKRHSKFNGIFWLSLTGENQNGDGRKGMGQKMS